MDSCRGKRIMDFGKYEKIKQLANDEVWPTFEPELRRLQSGKAELERKLKEVDLDLDALDERIRLARINSLDISVEQFKVDALREFGLTDHPKADDYWDIAWENGWDEGYEGVFDALQALKDLTGNV